MYMKIKICLFNKIKNNQDYYQEFNKIKNNQNYYQEFNKIKNNQNYYQELFISINY